MITEYLKKTGSRKLILMVLGNIIAGLGIALFKYSSLGNDPFSGMNMAVADHLPLSYANWQIIQNIIYFIIQFIFGRSLIGPGTIVNAIGLGYFVTFFFHIFTGIHAIPAAFSARVIVLLVGMIICSFGLSLYQTSDAGVSPYDSLALILTERFPKLSYFACRMICDGTCALICFLAGGIVGLGTLVTAFGFGPVIQFFNVHFSEKFVAKK